MIRILLADDEELVRTGLRLILSTEPDLEVVGEAADGQQAVELARTTAADVLLLDLRMPVLDGLAALRTLGDVPLAVVVLTTFDTDSNVREALASGAPASSSRTPPPTGSSAPSGRRHPGMLSCPARSHTGSQPSWRPARPHDRSPSPTT